MKKFLISVSVVFLWCILAGNILTCQNHSNAIEFQNTITIDNIQTLNKKTKDLITSHQADTKILAYSTRTQFLQNLTGFDAAKSYNKKELDTLTYNLKFKSTANHVNKNERLLFAIHPNAP